MAVQRWRMSALIQYRDRPDEITFHSCLKNKSQQKIKLGEGRYVYCDQYLRYGMLSGKTES